MTTPTIQNKQNKLDELISQLIQDGVSPEYVQQLSNYSLHAQNDVDQIDRQDYEEDYDTIQINEKIKDILNKYPNSRVLSDGSVVLYDNKHGIGVRHTRKDLLSTILVSSKCISGQILNFESNDPDYYPAPKYYQPKLNEKNEMIVIVPVGELKSNLKFGLSYSKAVELIKMLNKNNPGKEFFLENYY